MGKVTKTWWSPSLVNMSFKAFSCMKRHEKFFVDVIVKFQTFFFSQIEPFKEYESLIQSGILQNLILVSFYGNVDYVNQFLTMTESK